MKKAITYYRVSTDRQGKSGLGLEAQKQAVSAFAVANGFVLTAEFVEVESTRKSNRPKLTEALAACRRQQATLLIARLDRLGRSVAFISKLMEASIDFRAVDNPYANKLMVHIMAAFAEHERDLISKRTIDALKVAKERGVELGKHGRDVLSLRNKQRADDFARAMLPIVTGLRRNGVRTVRAIAQELNRLHVPTFREGGHWHVATVHQVMTRLSRT